MSAFEPAIFPLERPALGESGKAAFRVRFADRERRYVRKAGVTTVRRLEAFDS
jgi:hypothetical protein